MVVSSCSLNSYLNVLIPDKIKFKNVKNKNKESEQEFISEKPKGDWVDN